MNIRQLKKQYKRKHGINPPKGYSRAQIRKGIKSGLLDELIKRSLFIIGRAAEAVVYAMNNFAVNIKRAAEACGKAITENPGASEYLGNNIDFAIIDDAAFKPESEEINERDIN